MVGMTGKTSSLASSFSDTIPPHRGQNFWLPRKWTLHLSQYCIFTTLPFCIIFIRPFRRRFLPLLQAGHKNRRPPYCSLVLDDIVMSTPASESIRKKFFCMSVDVNGDAKLTTRLSLKDSMQACGLLTLVKQSNKFI